MRVPGGSDGHRRRWWPALVAGFTAVVLAALGGATNIATSLLPHTWAWAHDAVIVWGIVGVLLILAAVLAMTGLGLIPDLRLTPLAANYRAMW